MSELWKDIYGYEGFYQVSSLGRVRSLTRTIVMRNGYARTYEGRIINGGYGSGYRKVNLSNGVKKEFLFVHRLVCAAFHGLREKPYEVAHNDGNPENCKADNLRWALPIENAADRKRHGTSLCGTRHPQSTLTEEDVLKIRELYDGGEVVGKIAKMFKTSRQNVNAIGTRRSWVSISPPSTLVKSSS